MKLLKFLMFCLALMTTMGNSLWADNSSNIVVSIKPIHSLVAGVMGDTASPQLLLESNASPHTYQLRPSQAKSLQDADMVIWIGKYMENFLDRAVENLSSDARVLTLLEGQGMHKLPFREGGIWGIEGDHDHDEHHDHDEEKSHSDAHGHEHDHEHDEHGHSEHEHAAKEQGDHDHDHSEHEGHDHHDHGEFDVHIWLDPDNARRIVEILVDELGTLNPGHADIYRQNANKTIDRIDETAVSIQQQLSSIGSRRFIVFHDAYRYFEEAFGIEAFGSFTVEPTRLPSAKRMKELREAVNHHDVTCVFAEPQFKPDLVETVVEQTEVKTGVLDPLGAGIEPGQDAWFMIMQGLADSLTDCLGTE